MARLQTIGNATLRVYANDHLPPHFHIVAADYEALVEIETLTVLRGSVGGRHGSALLIWAEKNRDAIVAEWNRINPRFAAG